MNKVGTLILKNDVNAGLVALALVLLPLLSIPTGFLAAIVVSWVTLHKGLRSGGIVLIWVALPALCFTLLHKVNGYDILLASCVWLWLLSGLMVKYQSWRLILELSVLLGLIIVIGMHVFVSDVHMYWTGFLKNMLSPLLGAEVGQEEAQRALKGLQHLIPYMTGIVVSLQLLGVLVELMVARCFQVRSQANGSFIQEFSAIRLDVWMSVLLVLLVIGLFFKINLVMDFFPLIIFLFSFAGLSVLYYFKKQNKKWLYLIIFMYVLIFIQFFWAALLLTTVALIDVWFDLRKRGSLQP